LAPGIVPTCGARRTKFDFLINFLSLPPAAAGPIAQQALHYLDGTSLRYVRSRAVIFSPIMMVVKFVLEKQSNGMIGASITRSQRNPRTPRRSRSPQPA
jgi:hypothetical protein